MTANSDGDDDGDDDDGGGGGSNGERETTTTGNITPVNKHQTDTYQNKNSYHSVFISVTDHWYMERTSLFNL